jgi:predicted amidohydrolase
MRFDLLIRGGEVVDPGGGHEGLLDVAISRDRIAAVDRDIPADAAFRVIDASGQIVTPGLVDLHTHVFHKLTYWGIDPDPIASRSGVTTWNDAGSAGALTVEGFREFIVRPARVLGLEGEVGTLRPGARADVALFRLYEGAFPLQDIHGTVREARRLLRNTATYVGGRELERLPLPPGAPWTEQPIWPAVQHPFTEKQRELRELGRTPDAMAAAAGEGVDG